MAANSLKATLPSLQRTSVMRAENEGGKNLPRFARMISTTHLYLAAFASVTTLIYQPPHP